LKTDSPLMPSTETANTDTSAITVTRADLQNAVHQRDIVTLISAYATDPMGMGRPLPDAVRDNLIQNLQAHPTTQIFLAYAEGVACGLATCFVGFSTFTARPLINIHDLAVLPLFRNRGIGPQLLRAVEAEARAMGCVRLTLEVLRENHRARRVYQAFGFGPAGEDNAAEMLFLTKPLD
jgi:ribosomal protein S18 acetylase RimI-like enzyme